MEDGKKKELIVKKGQKTGSMKCVSNICFKEHEKIVVRINKRQILRQTRQHAFENALKRKHFGILNEKYEIIGLLDFFFPEYD